VWNILLVGELDHRIRFVMNKYKLNRSEAEKVVRKRDQIRNRFLGFFTEATSPDEPLSYDLVLNMTNISMDQAEDAVTRLVSR
jgi:cytidylate kinase